MSDKYLNILKDVWGYQEFRGVQRDIIESISNGCDTLGLMPTGGGKSITFQVPALAVEGVCIVITPLISLMKDQVSRLLYQGIRAGAIYSGMSHQEILKTLENCILGSTKFLYISPERISSELFMTKLKHMKVSFITVDEAHCISQWGYDFRPAYMNIPEIRRIKPNVAVLALTATATQNVIDDIQDKLGFAEKRVFSMSFERDNLAYIVRKTLDKEAELIHILKSVEGSSIVYVRSRRHTQEISKKLKEHDLNATFYHAGLDYAVKDQHQRDWQAGNIRIMVATNAFGMGIDKPDVRTVIHMDCPDSLEAYFQEAGRAGRDGNKSYSILLYNDGDKRKLSKRIADNFPEKDYIKDVYEHLSYYFQIGLGSGMGHTFEFDLDKFCRTFKFFPIQTNSALRILENSGYIEYEANPDASARLMFLIDRDGLYKLDNLTPNEDAVITSLLRNYGGLFTDYMYISESLVAQQAGVTEQQTYLILKGMSQRRILHFIPRRKTPYITYIQHREDIRYMIIPKEAYEYRKEQFVKRVKAVESYATNDKVCRSRQMLRYFGEKDSHDCNKCDVCIEQHPVTNKAFKNAQRLILDLINDGKQHCIADLREIHIPERQFDEALQYLVSEEVIRVDGNFISYEGK